MALTALYERFRPFNRDSVMVIAIDGEDLLLVRDTQSEQNNMS